MAILFVTCFDYTSSRGSRDEHVLVFFRNELINAIDGTLKLFKVYPCLRVGIEKLSILYVSSSWVIFFRKISKNH